MINSIELSPDNLVINFVECISGILDAFSQRIIIESKKKIVIPYEKGQFYSGTLNFKMGDFEISVDANELKPPLSDLSLISPITKNKIKDTYNLNNGALYFLARNITLDPKYDVFYRANSAVIMGYRALDIERDDLVFESIELINLLIVELQAGSYPENEKRIKFNKNHVLISLSLILAQLTIYSIDEASFIHAVNVGLKVVSDKPYSPYLKNSYYSLCMLLNLVAVYSGNENLTKIYDYSFNVSKTCYSFYSNEDPWQWIRELSQTFNRLSLLSEYITDTHLNEYKLFKASLRSPNHEKMYSKFKNFVGDGDINFPFD